MNSTDKNETWEEQKGILNEKFAALTDDDNMFTEGKKDEMFGRLEIKLSKTKEELRNIITTL